MGFPNPMPQRRRLRCGSCSSVMMADLEELLPVCDSCKTTHAFTTCGLASCSALVCLPEHIIKFNCPMCRTALSRERYQGGSGETIPMQCGVPECSWVMQVSATAKSFQCPRCSTVQAHPPSEDELRELALRQQEAAEERKGAKRDKELADLREALPWIDPTEVERVWRACECNRPRAICAVLDTPGAATAEAERLMTSEVARMADTVTFYERLLRAHTQCPLGKALMVDPVIAADGYTYDRAEIEAFLATSSASPLTGEALPHLMLSPNHQLKSELVAWRQCRSEGGSAYGPAQDSTRASSSCCLAAYPLAEATAPSLRGAIDDFEVAFPAHRDGGEVGLDVMSCTPPPESPAWRGGPVGQTGHAAEGTPTLCGAGASRDSLAGAASSAASSLLGISETGPEEDESEAGPEEDERSCSSEAAQGQSARRHTRQCSGQFTFFSDTEKSLFFWENELPEKCHLKQVEWGDEEDFFDVPLMTVTFGDSEGGRGGAGSKRYLAAREL